MPAPDLLKIHEIFFSIQGESLFVGKPTVFVRTAACNLRCRYCDTRYAFWHGTVMDTQSILQRVRSYPTRYVCLTGGEPLGQQAIYPLMDRLLEEGYCVSLETNGSFSIEKVPSSIVKVIDIKCPDSGEEPSVFWENCERVQAQDQFKFVVSSRRDFDWAQSVCEARKLHEKATVLYSPASGLVDAADLASWILEKGAPVTLQVQLHKALWGADRRGV